MQDKNNTQQPPGTRQPKRDASANTGSIPARTEEDALGKISLPRNCLYGIQTARALDNFAHNGPPVSRRLIAALALIKKAAAAVNGRLGFIPENAGKAIIHACDLVASGEHDTQFPLPALQGGAGTSTHMNVNEVIANLANIQLGQKAGDYHPVHPNDTVNLFQSTNDVYPTALRIAVLPLLRELSSELAQLQSALQDREKAFADILKTGRTQLQDALPLTLGQEFGAWAEAVARDRWRISKAEERLRQVNLGWTAIGTGINAPKIFIYRLLEEVRQQSGLPLARAENGVDATQNNDHPVEVMGLLKTCAVNLKKISADLRLLASGPRSGIGELALPPRQAGSSIMPGKVNPVIPEYAESAALRVFGHETTLAMAAGAGQLELNAFVPLIAEALLDSTELLIGAARSLRSNCIEGIEARRDVCETKLEQSHVLATLLSPYLGYTKTEEIVHQAEARGIGIREAVLESGLFTKAELDLVFSARSATAPGIAGAEQLSERLPFAKSAHNNRNTKENGD